MARFPHMSLKIRGRRRMLAIVCATCSRSDEISLPPVDTIERNFFQRGWSNPGDAKKAMCPVCIKTRLDAAKTLKAEKKKEIAPMPNLVKPPYRGAVPEAVIKAVPPRQPTPADRRRIHDVLDDAYSVEKQCYEHDRTDDTVAKFLDVPRAWVAEVREAFFGPDVSAVRRAAPAEIDAAIKRGESAITACMDAAAAAEAEVTALRALRKRLAEVA